MKNYKNHNSCVFRGIGTFNFNNIDYCANNTEDNGLTKMKKNAIRKGIENTGVMDFLKSDYSFDNRGIACKPVNYYKIEKALDVIIVIYGTNYGRKYDWANCQYEYQISLKNEFPFLIEGIYALTSGTTYGEEYIPLKCGEKDGIEINKNQMSSGSRYRYFTCYLKNYDNGNLVYSIQAGNCDKNYCQFTLPKDSKNIEICKRCTHRKRITKNYNDYVIKCKKLCWFYPDEYAFENYITLGKCTRCFEHKLVDKVC